MSHNVIWVPVLLVGIEFRYVKDRICPYQGPVSSRRSGQCDESVGSQGTDQLTSLRSLPSCAPPSKLVSTEPWVTMSDWATYNCFLYRFVLKHVPLHFIQESFMFRFFLFRWRIKCRTFLSRFPIAKIPMKTQCSIIQAVTVTQVFKTNALEKSDGIAKPDSLSAIRGKLHVPHVRHQYPIGRIGVVFCSVQRSDD